MPTQQQLDEIFAKLRLIHKSHWKAPKTWEVEKEIKRTGKYVFRIGADPWVVEVIITDSISYEVNPELPERMKKQVMVMKQKFESQ